MQEGLHSGGDVVSRLQRANSSNWKDFFNSSLVYIMFTKSDCRECEELELAINANEKINLETMVKVVLDDPGLAQLKIDQSWISNIDILPFNAIFCNGKMLESWSGGNSRFLEDRLSKY